MNEGVTYNQIISFARGDLLVRSIAKSYAEEGKLILVLDNSDRIIIEGKGIDTTSHKERAQELIDTAREQGFTFDPKAVTHYASSQTGEEVVEYILVKW